MFLYPFLDKLGVFLLQVLKWYLYRATLHEVAHVVGASNALGEIVSTNAIIEK